jgi:hypothetical protein
LTPTIARAIICVIVVEAVIRVVPGGQEQDRISGIPSTEGPFIRPMCRKRAIDSRL